MNAQVAALPDEKLIQPARAQLIDQLRALVVLEAMSSLRAGEFSTKVEPTATMNPLKERWVCRGDERLSIFQNLRVTLNHRYACARRASLLEIDNDQHELTDEHGPLGRCLLQSRGTIIE